MIDLMLLPLHLQVFGLKISDYERGLYDKGEFTKYYQVHGLGVELAEALAEVLHKQIRLDLDIVPKKDIL